MRIRDTGESFWTTLAFILEAPIRHFLWALREVVEIESGLRDADIGRWTADMQVGKGYR